MVGAVDVEDVALDLLVQRPLGDVEQLGDLLARRLALADEVGQRRAREPAALAQRRDRRVVLGTAEVGVHVVELGKLHLRDERHRWQYARVAATSARDPRVVRAARLLRDAGARREEGAFVVDDRELLREARAAGVEVEWVLAAEDASPDALRALAFAGQPPAVIAVCRTPQAPAGPLPSRSLVLAGVEDPGNVGSIVRSAAAFGLPRVALTAGCGDPWSRKALRAARGATFRRGLVAEGAALAGGPLAAAVPRGGVHPAELPPDASVVLGAEAAGLSAEERARCDLAVTIPAPGFESLNVAAAAAILAWELARRD